MSTVTFPAPEVHVRKRDYENNICRSNVILSAFDQVLKVRRSCLSDIVRKYTGTQDKKIEIIQEDDAVVIIDAMLRVLKGDVIRRYPKELFMKRLQQAVDNKKRLEKRVSDWISGLTSAEIVRVMSGENISYADMYVTRTSDIENDAEKLADFNQMMNDLSGLTMYIVGKGEAMRPVSAVVAEINDPKNLKNAYTTGKQLFRIASESLFSSEWIHGFLRKMLQTVKADRALEFMFLDSMNIPWREEPVVTKPYFFHNVVLSKLYISSPENIPGDHSIKVKVEESDTRGMRHIHKRSCRYMARAVYRSAALSGSYEYIVSALSNARYCDVSQYKSEYLQVSKEQVDRIVRTCHEISNKSVMMTPEVHEESAIHDVQPVVSEEAVNTPPVQPTVQAESVQAAPAAPRRETGIDTRKVNDILQTAAIINELSQEAIDIPDVLRISEAISGFQMGEVRCVLGLMNKLKIEPEEIVRLLSPLNTVEKSDNARSSN